MMRAGSCSPENLLPHDPPMVLLDEVLNGNDKAVSAALTVRPEDRFFVPGRGIPAHLGLEWMAQACGLYAGLQAYAAGRPAALGFLLGTRRYRATRAWFTEGERLQIGATLVFREGGMAVFDCVIRAEDGEELAVAQLTTYQPEDPAAVLSNQAMG